MKYLWFILATTTTKKGCFLQPDSVVTRSTSRGKLGQTLTPWDLHIKVASPKKKLQCNITGFLGFRAYKWFQSILYKVCYSLTLSCRVLLWIWENDLSNFGIRLLCLVSAKQIQDTRQAVHPSVKYSVTVRLLEQSITLWYNSVIS